MVILCTIFLPVSGNLNPVTDFIKADYLFLGEEKTESGLDFLYECTHGQFLSRFQVVEPTGGVSFPFGWEISCPEKALSCLDRKATQLCSQYFFIAPDLFKESQTEKIILTKGILNKSFTVQITKNISGYRGDCGVLGDIHHNEAPDIF